MSSLDDLRSTLEQHADGLDDTERYVRPVAVRARIRGVRRRRTALVSAAAVLVLIATAAAVGTLRGPAEIQPADRVVAGVDVPENIEVLDFPYTLHDLRELDESVRLKPSDEDQAVVLAASGLGSGSATLYSDGVPVARVRGDQQVALPYPVGGDGTTLKVRLHGTDDGARAGVAVYEATGELAPGVSNGDVVFRDTYASQPLLGAAFAEPGESSVDFEAGGAATMRLVTYCDGADDLMVNVALDGEPGIAIGCNGGGRDASGGSSGTLDRLDPDRKHDVRVYLTRGSDDTEVPAPAGLVFGAGVYAQSWAPQRTQGQDLPRQVEYAGRTWVFDDIASDPLDLDAGDDDVLLGLVGSGPELRATWKGRLSSGESSALSSPDRGTSTLGGVLLAGDRYDVRLTGGEGDLVLYRPL